MRIGEEVKERQLGLEGNNWGFGEKKGSGGADSERGNEMKVKAMRESF